MKINKIQLQLIIIKILVNILFFTVIIFTGWILNKLIESLILLLSFFIYRSAFEKEFHQDTITQCIKTTLSIFAIAIMSLIPNTFSFVSPIIFGFIICFVTYKYEDYLELKYPKKEKNNREIIIDILGKNNINEDYIESFCAMKGMPNLSETIFLFMTNTVLDVSAILEIDRSTIFRRINKFIKRARELNL